jgi:hypothetical protein
LAQDSGITIHIEGAEHRLDDFELGDLEWLEEYLGTTLDDNAAMNSMKAAVGLVYLIKRKDDPSFTLDQARKVRLSVFDAPEETGNGKAKRRPPKAAKAA